MSKRSLLAASLLLLAIGAALAGYVLVRERASARADAAAAAADSAAALEAKEADRRAARVARRLAAQTDSVFQAVALLSSAEKRRLRRYLQPEHLESARRLGRAPVGTRRAAADLEAQPPAESGVVRIRTNDFYILDPAMSYAVPLVVPSAAHLLRRIGRRFQGALLAQGLPPYRFVLTNVLRTGQDQAALRGTNANAAPGQSTHEYGTTFDVFYEWFHYAAVHDTLARQARHHAARAAPLNDALLRRRLYAAYTRFGKTHAPKLKAVLGRALLAMQEEGLLLAIYERYEPVFHLTVARAVEPPAPPFRPALGADSARAATRLPAERGNGRSSGGALPR